MRPDTPLDCAVLIRMSGQEAGRVHPVTPEVMTLGRGRVCTIQFDDVTLSRVHARIVRHEEQFVLEDSGSLNGCYVNDERVSRALLRDGDRVRLGSGASLRFQMVSADEEQALCRIYEASVRDGLTGLYNRKHLDERLAAEVSYSLRHRSPLSLVMLDIDRFKQINDTHGHLAGDVVLKKVALILSSLVRAEDTVGRYGGEEFVIVVRSTSSKGAAQLAERVRAAVEKTRTPFAELVLQATVSAGVACLLDLPFEWSVAALIACADARLYQAKASGRNCVVYA
jgi:diguanylate cyclase (GGDEF)-like protein